MANLAPAAPLTPLFPIDAFDAPYPELARIKAEAIADLPRQELELARIQARDIAANAMAVADLQVAASLDAMRYAPIAEAPFALGLTSTRTGGGSGYRTEAPEAWAQQDPADSLYREARKALTGESYEKAASLYNQIWRRYPASVYTPDAYYWQAFALMRQGGDRNLGEALASLETQQQKFPKASTRGDANALRNRIEGQLGRAGDMAVATTLRGRAERAASDGCPRADEDERIEALNAVMQMDQEQAMPILKKVLARREPCTQQLRRTAVMLVARRNQPEVASTLMGVAKNDPDKDVREQAVFWMANVQSDDATSMLIDLAKNGDDLDLRKRAIYALSRSKSPKAAETLRQIALDEKQPDDIRSDALTWAFNRPADRDNPQTVSFYKELFGKTGTINFRQRVLGAISQARTDEARNFLVSVALNEREPMDLRRTAVSSISGSSRWGTLGSLSRLTAPRAVGASAGGGQVSSVVSTNVSTTGSLTFAGSGQSASGSNDQANAESTAAAVAALGTVYDKSGDTEIRRAALSSLSSMRDNAGLDKILDIARNEKNSELRRSAVSMLSRTKDPRAVQLLQEIINK